MADTYHKPTRHQARHVEGDDPIPTFGPSGQAHARGLVPSPGAQAGATRYLREDGLWNTPAGGGGSPTTTEGDLIVRGAQADVRFAAPPTPRAAYVLGWDAAGALAWVVLSATMAMSGDPGVITGEGVAPEVAGDPGVMTGINEEYARSTG